MSHIAIIPGLPAMGANKFFSSLSCADGAYPQFKVLWAIIISYAIQVMYCLTFAKKTAKFFFYNKAMFKYAAIFRGLRMFRGINILIASCEMMGRRIIMALMFSWAMIEQKRTKRTPHITDVPLRSMGWNYASTSTSALSPWHHSVYRCNASFKNHIGCSQHPSLLMPRYKLGVRIAMPRLGGDNFSATAYTIHKAIIPVFQQGVQLG